MAKSRSFCIAEIMRIKNKTGNHRLSLKNRLNKKPVAAGFYITSKQNF
jgi:hypothetical protein